MVRTKLQFHFLTKCLIMGSHLITFTFPFVLKAFSALSAIEKGRKIHEHAIRTGWETDVFVGAGLVDMYAKCGCVESARQVFDKIEVRDAVLRNSIIYVVKWVPG
jgi:pentatricopeptide repeat protein